MSLVLYETQGPIGIITLNRPEMHNCMNIAMIKELDQVLDSVDLDTIRCLIITGTGDAFSSGSDINELIKLNSREAIEYSEMGNDVFLKLGEFPIPTIAAINGIALGGGDELSLSCASVPKTRCSAIRKPVSALHRASAAPSVWPTM